jgi:XTP/dITP diphosphohydrolase
MTVTRLLVATNNDHKIREFTRLFGGTPIELITPRALGLELDVVEDGATFAENAAIKARAFAAASGMPALADDSGIEVDALGGRPGVQSARYGGAGLTDEDRVALLLRELAGVPDRQRACRYRVVLVLAEPDGGPERVAEGATEGRVAHAAAGQNGFGYDPVFFVPDHGRTMAELSPAEKDAISHRGRAARALVDLLRSENAHGSAPDR